MLDRRLSGGAAATLRLSIDAAGLIQGDGEDLLFLSQRARIGTLLQIRAVAPVLRGDHHAVVLAHLARQGKQLEGLLQSHSRGFHGAKQRSRTRLELVLDVLLDALFLLLRGRLGFPILGALAFLGALLVFLGALLGDYLLGLTLGLLPLILADDFGDIRAEATLLGHDHAAVFWVLTQLAAALRSGEELFRQLLVQAIRGDGFGQVSALILDAAVVVGTNGALDIRAVAAYADENVAALGVGIKQ